MKNLLFLGGLGFIGTNIINELLDKYSELEITVFDKPGKVNSFGSRIRFFPGDFQNEISVENALSSASFDGVVHLVSTTIPATSNEKIAFDIEANLVPTVRLLQLMVKHEVPDIIFFSSGGSVYGTVNSKTVNELDQTFPISSHGTVKLAIEKYLHLFQELYGISYLILRVGNPYGPFQTSDDQGIINVFIRKILKNEKLVIRGDGSAIRDYIYVKDLARIVGQMIDNKITNNIVNIGSGTGTSVNEILDILRSVSGKELRTKFTDPLPADVSRIVLDISKLKLLVKSELVPIGEGIRLTYEHMLSEALNKDNFKR
jgi:UDP-glucose 4-epimerase